jgi:hypothetical protein
VIHGREQMVQVVVTEIGQRSKQGAVHSRSLPHSVQLSQSPVAVYPETMTQTGRMRCSQ